jgi:hypothetical protein
VRGALTLVALVHFVSSLLSVRSRTVQTFAIPRQR